VPQDTTEETLQLTVRFDTGPLAGELQASSNLVIERAARK
jgi:hypothetical protein